MKNKSFLNRGITFVEMMVAVAILGLLAVLTIPKLTEALKGSEVGVGEGLQGNIQSHYDQWVSLGASHTTAASDELTLALLTHLTSAPTSTINAANYTVTVAGDTEAIIEPRRSQPGPSTIRFSLPKGLPTLTTVAGSPVLLYDGRYAISFTPTTARSGTWTVSLINP